MAVGRRGQEDNTRIENWLKSFELGVITPEKLHPWVVSMTRDRR
jgi:hypothetical protein